MAMRLHRYSLAVVVVVQVAVLVSGQLISASGSDERNAEVEKYPV
jgi:hypothetical protein